MNPRYLIFIFCFISVATYAQSDVDSLDIKIGQMIMVGLDGKSLRGEDSLKVHLQEGLAGSIIFFEKNIANTNSASTLKKLSEDLQSISRNRLLIGIDEEGGLVHRLKSKYGFIDIPSPQYFGKINNYDSTFHYADTLSGLLNSLGINLNFAPVVDLGNNPDNPVIAKLRRSYSANPDSVAHHAEAFMRASLQNDVIPVLKHFPGHGSSDTDSHRGMTDVTDTWQLEEIFPYSSLLSRDVVDAVMSAHIINHHLDPDSLPATLSGKVISGLLRQVMGFDGVVFSDDMQMHAISKHFGFENSIYLGINAGLDIFVFANNVYQSDQKSAREIHRVIRNLVETGQISEERIDQSYQRIKKLKQKYGIWEKPKIPAITR